MNTLLCSICKKPLIGYYRVDVWGNKTCAAHENEYQRCSSCLRLMSAELSGGRRKLQDGRCICGECFQRSIFTKVEAKPWIEAAAAWLYVKGFKFKDLALNFDLVGLKSLQQGISNSGGLIQGKIIKEIVGTNRRVKCVLVLYGLPSLLMQGVFIHELAHAWLFLEKIDGISLETEEGFCNALSYAFYKDANSQEAKAYMKVIEENSDKIYGDGFRMVRDAIKQHGANKVIESLKNFKSIP